MTAIRKISIYDMDGTIVDSSHRYRTITTNGVTRIDLPYWRANEYRAMDDGLLPLAEQYRAELNDPSVYVIIATARVLNAPDIMFIEQILGKPNYIISRAATDNRSGAVLKINGLQKFFNLKQFRIADAVFYEDNISYLKVVCDHFGIIGVYIPSKQGH
jgi:beta-phosphoglucomutase-like phosphatase (HAD superfamily)